MRSFVCSKGRSSAGSGRSSALQVAQRTCWHSAGNLFVLICPGQHAALEGSARQKSFLQHADAQPV